MSFGRGKDAARIRLAKPRSTGNDEIWERPKAEVLRHERAAVQQAIAEATD